MKHFKLARLPVIATALCATWLCTQSDAATITAPSCSNVDVQAAIDTAQDGDTVAIPKGTCTWATTVNVGTQTAWIPPAWNTKALTLRVLKPLLCGWPASPEIR